MAVTAFEPVCDIAGVRAVFPVPVPVGREPSAASGAGEEVDGLPVDLLGMCVPPAEAAGVTAEPGFLPSGLLPDRFPAETAVGAVRRILVT